MAPDEYSTGGGGKLKLKGSKTSDGRVEKKKKKSLKKKEKAEQDQPSQEPDAESKSPPEDEEPESSAAKTEAERKYEEIRRKRVCTFLNVLQIGGLIAPRGLGSRANETSCVRGSRRRESRRTRSVSRS